MIILKNEQYKNLTYLESDNKDEYYFASKYYFFNKIKPEKAFLLGFQRNESIEKYLLVYIISGKFYDTYNNPVKLNLKNGETSINGFSFELNTSNIKPRNFQSQISDVENCAPNCSTLYIMSDGREIRVDEILFSTEPRYVEEEFLIYKIEQTLVSMCM